MSASPQREAQLAAELTQANAAALHYARSRLLGTWFALALLALGVAILFLAWREQSDTDHEQSRDIAELADDKATEAEQGHDEVVSYLRGEQGIPGVPGADGDEGSPGQPGSGEAGAAGERGERGAQGPAGPTGAPGPAGQVGAVGPAGVGEPGAPGASGERGQRGEQGEQGERGPRGERGPAGATGPAGPAGPAGAAGVVTCPAGTAPSLQDLRLDPQGSVAAVVCVLIATPLPAPVP